MYQMTPREIISELSYHIIGQEKAKKSVAIALRNRWRRMQLSPELRNEITPKNILMIGPTGVGKTEIARRLSKLANAPFIKVEATKFTEVGYVGRDVESIIRDLIEVSMKMTKEDAKNKVQKKAFLSAEEKILHIIILSKKKENNSKNFGFSNISPDQKMLAENPIKETEIYKEFRKKLFKGELDDIEIDIELSNPQISMEIMAPPGMEEMTQQLQNLFENINSGNRRKKTRKVPVKSAFKILQEEEIRKLINLEEIKSKAIENLEQNGIIFIDEIDKICKRENFSGGGDISREGVQRDLLPLLEGSTVSTKYGMIKTDHILFIASGAFHLSKPSDLIPELQGRLPIRVELKALSVRDFKSILTKPKASLVEQYSALLKTEGVNIKFQDDAIHRIAEIAWKVNEEIENIGARRLHTLMECLLEDISFNASDQSKKNIIINKEYVNLHLKILLKSDNLSKYIL